MASSSRLWYVSIVAVLTALLPGLRARAAERLAAGELVATWPEFSRVAALQMIAEYGAPGEVTDARLIWHDAGPYKRITVLRTGVAHDFPRPHLDVLQHTIAYRVPPGKADALYDFDGAITFDRNAGELSASCDSESHNILALNLANEIVGGKTDPAGARAALTRAIEADLRGNAPAIMKTLQFEPARETSGDPDKSSIPGAPEHAPVGANHGLPGSGLTGDANVLGYLVALGDNLIAMAREAENRPLRTEIRNFAKTLHEEQGANSCATMELAQRVRITAVETAATDAIRRSSAAQLGRLLVQEDAAFERACLRAIIKEQTAALDLIDNLLVGTVQNPEVKRHLLASRGLLDRHLQEARRMYEANTG